MSDSVRRALRTLLDVLLAVLAAGVVDAFVVDLDATQRSTVVVALTGAISVLKNALEDRGTIPAILKAPASSGADPLPGPSTAAGGGAGGAGGGPSRALGGGPDRPDAQATTRDPDTWRP